MNKKECQRKSILDQRLQGLISYRDAIKRLQVSERQYKRILTRYKEEGDRGLIHKHCGQPSGYRYPPTKKEAILKCYEEKYNGFGPTFAAEKLAELDELTVHPETLRLWLKAAGLWHSHRKRKQHRSRRTRRSRFGELLQLDGSIHAWFDGINEKQCLMNMVDDATGKTLAIMDTGETTQAAFALLRWWIEEAGIPMAIYVDLKSLYISPKSLRRDEEGELIEPGWLTHFSRACQKLGIEVIKAYSPQAKGRVERKHAVYQDRLVKELKLRNIQTIKGANQVLSRGFVNGLNEKFARPARDEADAHVPLGEQADLNQIFCWEFNRKVKQDWTIQFERQHYQIENRAKRNVSPRATVTIRRHMDHAVSCWYQGECLAISLIEEKPVIETSKKPSLPNRGDSLPHPKTTGHHNSPWRQFNPNWLSSKQTTETIPTT